MRLRTEARDRHARNRGLGGDREALRGMLRRMPSNVATPTGDVDLPVADADAPTSTSRRGRPSASSASTRER